MEPPIEFEKVSFDEAKKALETKVADDKVKGYHGERAPERGDPLLESTKRWLNELPAPVRPTETARDFPRIANKLAELWKRPSRCDEYFQTLLLDKRGGRKGFPLAVGLELGTLSDYYAKQHPYKHSIWDDVRK